MDRSTDHDRGKWARRIFGVSSETEFEKLALELFRYQHKANPLYREFCGLLGVDPLKVDHYREIPFLPVEFFRDHRVISGNPGSIGMVFTSSGTTGSLPSRHYVTDLSLYRESFRKAFGLFYGDPSMYTILALLPGYLERPGSSLVFMMEDLIGSGAEGSGFYLHEADRLESALPGLHAAGRGIFLFGVSHALLDFAMQHPVSIPGAIVMETGGMKGRKKEMVREELHSLICRGLDVEKVHAEYGMTELLSQAYSQGSGLFRTPPWMRVLVRDVNDPLSLLSSQVTGGLNIIDLANLNSCAFIATQDLGRIHPDGSFEVLGRFDSSDIRGCSLLIS